MPLLRRQPFVPARPPKNLRAEEQVFLVPLTNEIFRDYDAFFEQTIHLNSMVWSCSVTGRAGLTFEEALESERSAQQSLDSFPESLERPLLALVELTRRGRIDDLVSDVWLFMRDRFFVGEHVQLYQDGARRPARVLAVSSDCAHSAADPLDKPHHDQSSKAANDECTAPPPASYSYEVELLVEDDEDSASGESSKRVGGLPHTALFRHRSACTKPKLKLFLKNACEVRDLQWAVKRPVVAEYDLDALDWQLVLAGPKPKFPQTPATKNWSMSGSAAGESNAADAAAKAKRKPSKKLTPAEAKRKAEQQRLKEEQRLKLVKQEEEVAVLLSQAEYWNVDADLSRWQDAPRKPLSNDDMSELRLLVKTAREAKRELQREQKRREREAQLEWKRPRDDLLCDDLKALPPLTPLRLPDWLSGDMFGECLSLAEFFHSYRESVAELPVDVSLRTILDALVCDEPDGALAELLTALLHARAARGDEEDGDEANLQNKDELPQENCDLDNRAFGDAIREATAQHERVRHCHGVAARHLPVDPFTLTEVLRLHIVTSGYYSGQVTARFRYQSRGGFRCWDDHGLMTHLNGSPLIGKLESGSVFDLAPVERLEVLTLLRDQLLSFYCLRDKIDKRLDELKTVKATVRALTHLDQSQERDADIARYRLEHPDECPAKEKSEENGVSENGSATPEPTEKKPSSETLQLKRLLATQRSSSTTRRYKFPEKEVERLLSTIAYDEFDELDEINELRELQREQIAKRQRRLLGRVVSLRVDGGAALLGYDRAFRRYWLCSRLPLILVEHSESLSGGCYVGGTPASKRAEGAEEPSIDRRALLACTGEASCCPAHSPTTTSAPAWSFVPSADALGQLLGALNPRGHRESDLLENLSFLKPHLVDVTSNTAELTADGGSVVEFPQRPVPTDPLVRTDWDGRLREMLLDLEDKVYSGGLGSLGLPDRAAWRRSLEEGAFEPQTSDVSIGGVAIHKPDDLPRLSRPAACAVALLQIANGIDVKFLRAPFAAPPIALAESANGERPPALATTPMFARWKHSVLQCGNYSQVALHLSTLEPAVQWKKSRLQARCRLCRRKGDANTVALCHACDRAFHIYCVRPKLKELPSRDWLCADCRSLAKADERLRALSERQRSASEAADEDNDDDLFDAGYSDADESASDVDCAECAMPMGRRSRRQCDECTAVAHARCAGPSSAQWACTDCRAAPRTTTSSGRVVKRRCLFEEVLPAGAASRGRREQLNGYHGRAKRARLSRNGSGWGGEGASTGARRASGSANGEDDDDEEAVENGVGEAKRAGLRRDDGAATEQLRGCQRLVEKAMLQDDAEPFLKPVTRKQAPDYFDVIAQPMDLGTILNKLKNRRYGASEEVLADAKRMFANCYKYNMDGSPIFECGQRLEAFVCRLFEQNAVATQSANS